jgi:hypothetical protein
MNAPSIAGQADELIARARMEHWTAARMSGHLVRSPFAGALQQAELGMLVLSDPSEFREHANAEQHGQAPILLSPGQRYAWLAALVRGARERIPYLSTVLVRLTAPDFLVQLPADLLAADVLLVNDAAELVPRLVARGCKGIMVIDHQLRVDGFECGDNRLTLTVYGEHLIADFIDYIGDLQLSRYLDNWHLQRHGISPAKAEHSDLGFQAYDDRPPSVEMTQPLEPLPLRVHAILHWRIRPPFLPLEDALAVRIEALGRCIGAQVGRLKPLLEGEAVDYFICSTYLSSTVSANPRRVDILFDSIEASCGMRPSGLAQTYECVGWGYVLRFLNRHMRARRVLLSIVDVDLHNLGWYRYNPAIGFTGFGCTALILDLPNRPCDLIADGPYPNSAFREFIRAVRNRHARSGRSRTFIPFLTSELRQVAERMIGSDLLWPNRNAELGHCMGSDPWIGLIEWISQERPSAPEIVTAGAMAYSGYYTCAAVEADAATLTEFREIDGNDGAFTAAVGKLGCFGAAA